MADKKSGFGMDEVPVGSNGDVRKPSDVVDLYDLPDKKFVKMRFFGDVFPYGGHWIETKKKDGGKASFYHPCAAFDLATGKVDSTKACAFCDDETGLVRFATDYFMNAIHRKDQSNEPEKIKMTKSEADSGFKDKASESWTPVKAVRLTGSVLRRLRDLRQLNTHEGPDGETLNYPVSHPKYGVDVSIKRDKSLAPAQMYETQMGSPSPMKKNERAYLIWDLTELMITPTEEATAAEHKKWAERMGLIKPSAAGKGKKKVDEDDSDEDEDEEDAPKSKSKKPDPKSKKKVADDFDEDEDEDEDDAPKSKSKSKSKPKDDDFDEDEDEDEKPKGKSKKKVVDEDDDEDEDDAPKSKSKVKKKVVDDFDEDEDEDEKPAPKSKKKKVVDEDDEDDEKPSKKKKAKKPVDEDDDDFGDD